MLAYIKRYIHSTCGSIAIAFAVLAPVLVGATGMAIDYAQAYLVQQRLAQAIDAAALAGAASSTDAAEIEQKVKEFFDVNYPPEKIGATLTPVVDVTDNEVHVSAHAEYHTFFLTFIDIDEIDVSAETTVQRQIQGLEVVLVLDNTGSMSSSNNIQALKDATESFVNILFNRAVNDESIKVGMVPYANAVRVGRYGLGLTPDGETYGDGSAFVNLPPDMNYTNDHTSSDWYGCVVEHNPNGYTSSASYVSNSKGQLWKDGTDWDGHGWDPSYGDNDPYDYDVLDEYEGPWDVYSYGRIIANNQKCSSYSGYSNSRCSDCTGSYGRCNSDYCFCWKSNRNNGTNESCPYASVLPLTSDRDALLDHTDDMVAHGFTLGNIGMAWGARLLSPEYPFEEGVDWNNNEWRKAIVMMTDGNNTHEGTYSAYWSLKKNNLGVYEYNERFEETCEALKEKGVIIYTVTFTSNINNTTKGYYERCATSEDQYFDAPTQGELIAVFEQISRELSNLHIKN